ncbi:MAG: NAD(P)H-hydrate epimerase [Haloarculaceae archaeon]
MSADPDPAFRTPGGRGVPSVTAAEMREVDRVAVKEVGVSLLMMMEHAGRSLADPLRGYDGRVVVLGPDTTELTGAAATQFGVLREMGVSPAPDGAVARADLVVDALVGYGLSGPLRGRTADLVERVGGTDAEIRSLDVPSGVNATTGERAGVDYEWPYGDGATVDLSVG